MVNVDDKTSQIRLAVYGKDVRESLASGIEAIADEVNKFENSTNNKQTEYENKINKDLSEYKESLNQRQSDYETKINNEFVEYKNNVDEDISAYKINLNGEWKNYKQIIDNDELDRKENEIVRQCNEKIRIENENNRIQNEIIRKNNEYHRQKNESDRETAFEGMQHIDANLELSTARGTFENLNERLLNTEGELLVNKQLVSIAHNMKCYPIVRCLCGYYGAGVGVIGSNKPAGEDSHSINTKIIYKDTNNIVINVPEKYLINSPTIEKIDNNRYIISSDDSTEIRSILIDLREVL